jgi:BNR/Asp-box repeat protein
MRAILRFVAFVCLSAAAAANAADGAAPRLDAWRILGPGGGGTFYHPAVSPHDPRLVVETTDMTSGYVSTDGGESWRLFQLGGSPLVFAFDPVSPSVIYAANAALWRSEDGARTWRLVFPSPERNTVTHHWSDHGDTVYTTDEPLYPSGRYARIHAVGVDPSDPRQLLLALSSRKVGPPGTTPESDTAILESRDRGRRWERRGSLGQGRALVLWIEKDGLARVLATDGAWEGSSGGWQHFAPPSGARFDSGSFGRDASSGRTLVYATSPFGPNGTGGLHVSEDGGRTWRTSGRELAALSFGTTRGEAWGPAATSRPMLYPVSASAGHGLVAYVGLRGLRHAEGGPKFNGIARTADGGMTWTIVHEEADRPSANLRGSWVEERALEDGYSVWFDAPTDLGVGPEDPDVCFATDLFRTYRTTDGGKTWAQLNSVSRGDDAWVSRGLDVTTTYGVHFDPFDSRRVFVSTTDIGLFRSDDGGASWIDSSRGVPKEWRNTTYWVVFDPEERGLAWAAFSGTHDLPRPKMWRRADPGSFRGGVGISTDGARTWTPSWKGAPEGAVTHLLLDPASPKGRRTLYACVFGRGVYKSTDGGASWTAKNAGIEQRQPFAWRISGAGDGTLYLVVARRSEGGRIGDDGDGALYRSRDGGDRWERMALPPGINGPNALTPDPTDPRRLYLSAWPVATPGGDIGGGLLLSEDAGATWTRLRPDSEYVYDLTLDPRDPSVLYFTGHDQAAWRSADRGKTWTRLGGFNFKQGHRVVPDPNDPSKVYITTFGSFVWHGPATGDPNAVEDVVR